MKSKRPRIALAIRTASRTPTPLHPSVKPLGSYSVIWASLSKLTRLAAPSSTTCRSRRSPPAPRPRLLTVEDGGVQPDPSRADAAGRARDGRADRATRTLSCVRVHAVLTGPVDTDMVRDLGIPKSPSPSPSRRASSTRSRRARRPVTALPGLMRWPGRWLGLVVCAGGTSVSGPGGGAARSAIGWRDQAGAAGRGSRQAAGRFLGRSAGSSRPRPAWPDQAWRVAAPGYRCGLSAARR